MSLAGTKAWNGSPRPTNWVIGCAMWRQATDDRQQATGAAGPLSRRPAFVADRTAPLAPGAAIACLRSATSLAERMPTGSRQPCSCRRSCCAGPQHRWTSLPGAGATSCGPLRRQHPPRSMLGSGSLVFPKSGSREGGLTRRRRARRSNPNPPAFVPLVSFVFKSGSHRAPLLQLTTNCKSNSGVVCEVMAVAPRQAAAGCGQAVAGVFRRQAVRAVPAVD